MRCGVRGLSSGTGDRRPGLRRRNRFGPGAGGGIAIDALNANIRHERGGNAIPAAAIERIEVLTDGASVVYGSDAIRGVVNFILRSNYQSSGFSANYGSSAHDDGQRASDSPRCGSATGCAGRTS